MQCFLENPMQMQKSSFFLLIRYQVKRVELIITLRSSSPGRALLSLYWFYFHLSALVSALPTGSGTSGLRRHAPKGQGLVALSCFSFTGNHRATNFMSLLTLLHRQLFYWAPTMHQALVYLPQT